MLMEKSSKYLISYIEVELTEDETQFLLTHDYVKIKRAGRELMVVYMANEDAYDIAEVISEHSIKLADI